MKQDPARKHAFTFTTVCTFPRVHYPGLPSSVLTHHVNPVTYFLIAEAPPKWVFADGFLITDHKRALVFFFSRYIIVSNYGHMQVARKYFNNGKKRGKFIRRKFSYLGGAGNQRTHTDITDNGLLTFHIKRHVKVAL